MALKYQIDKLEDVAAPLREHYTAKDGKYQLTLDGGHPDTARVAEFRETNIGLKKQVEDLTAKFDGIDPAAAKATAARLAALEQAKPDERIAALESLLAAATKRANDGVLRDAITGAFLKAGGRPAASDFILSKGEKLFTVAADGTIASSAFDPDQPGVKLSVEAFINQQTRESSFAFMASSGSGASPIKSGSGSGGRAGVTVIRNPSAQDLGKHGQAAREGKVRFEYD